MQYDLTSKLSFEENPVIAIKGELFEVNADAETMLSIMGDFDTKSQVGASLSAYEKLFSENARKKISEFKLSMKDLMTVIQTAMLLAQGEDPDKDVQETAPRTVL